jgi:acyl-CoA synthetase (AMP-forming)/AMP-acid ligase II/thioesterase domain-containing protein/acyl carrier protein
MKRDFFLQSLQSLAQTRPNDIAFNYKGTSTWTFGEFYQNAHAFDQALKQLNISQNDRIGIVFSTRPYYVLMMSALYTNVISIVLKGTLDETSLIAQALERGVHALITDRVTPSLIDACTINQLGLIKVLDEPSPSLTMIVDYKRSVEEVNDDPIIFINTSSGTTGQAKTFPRRLSEVLAIIDQEVKTYHLNGVTRLLTAYVDNSSNINNILKAIYSGASLVSSDGVDPQHIYELCHSLPIHHMRIAPATMTSIFEYSKSRNIDYKSCALKEVVVTGASIQPSFVSTFKDLFNARLIHTYGSTETSNVASNVNAVDGYKEGSVGIVEHHEIKIIDGEVCVKAPMVFKGYENMDNSSLFIDGFFRTGDHGSLDSQGYLFIHGRFKELINRGGEKVSPVKIENLIDQLQWFKECAVFSILNDQGFEDIACVVVKKHRSYNIKELREALMRNLPAYHCPNHLIEVNEIEKTMNGKISRKLLSEQYQSLLSRHEKSYDDMEAILKSCLNQTEINLQDSFVMWGGDSIKYATLMSLIQHHLHKHVALNELMACKNMQAMIELVNHLPLDQRRYTLTWLRKAESSQPTIIFVHPKSGDVVTYRYVIQAMEEHLSIAGLTFDPRLFDASPPYQVNEIIQVYVNALLEEGLKDIVLCGLSVGGKIALLLAKACEAYDITVHHVVMLDTTTLKETYHRKWNLNRSFRLMKFDIQTRRFGSIPNYILTKIKKLVFNRIIRRKTLHSVKESVAQKLIAHEINFSPLEIEHLVTQTFNVPMPEYVDVSLTYLWASKERDDRHAKALLHKVKSIDIVKTPVFHSDFVDIDAALTASILNELLKKIHRD